MTDDNLEALSTGLSLAFITKESSHMVKYISG